ncbi:NAD(P)H-binding protein [Pelomonas sp. KK5]|uniref:NAD(P)H-binding protein n=1 Tax=Pelomonas sp. KK5 TaxID=1855730 RepID=UPI00097C7AA4|nr:NAD(P)H-binding protein [Pelomonas sp. KK5]
MKQPVWIAGASGLVGRELLKLLLDREVDVHALLRRAVPDLPRNEHLHQHTVDFAHLDASRLPAPQAVYIALGTTIAVAGSQEAFKAVDLDAVVNTAKAAREAGARRCAVVSALGASAGSSVFYNRVKGEMEQALQKIGFEHLVIARPSLLIGERAALGQPVRRGEVWGERLTRPLRALIPARLRPIEATRVARAMDGALLQDEGPAVQVLESDALQRLGR